MKDNHLLIGKISRPHGIKGRVRVVSYADSPDTFIDIGALSLKDRAGSLKTLHINSVTPQKGAVILGFEELASRSDAEKIAGCDLYIDKSLIAELPEGEYYHFELMGLEIITTEGLSLGKITQIIQTGSNDVFVVAKEKEEHLIPAVRDFIREIDIEKGIMVIEPPEGLI